jgi:hypothetical protein
MSADNLPFATINVTENIVSDENHQNEDNPNYQLILKEP